MLGMGEVVFASVLLGLTLGSVGYNLLVAWFQKKHQGYTAFFVVGGVLWTLGGAAILIGIEDALMVLVCFAFSGLPMVLGSMLRNRDDGEEARELAGELLDGEQTDRGRVQVPGVPGGRNER